MTNIPPPRNTGRHRYPTVSRRIVTTFVNAPGHPLLRTTLTWSPNDPIAVKFRFPSKTGPKIWFIARELIFDALANYGGAGAGDARFTRDPFCADFLLLHLETPKGYGLLRMRRSTLGSFLAATVSHECADPAAELEEWLARGAAGSSRQRRTK